MNPDAGPYQDPYGYDSPKPTQVPPMWTGPHMDPKPAQEVHPVKPANWFNTLPPVAQMLIGAAVSVLLQLLTQWGIPATRPPATAVDPSAPTAQQAVKGSQAAAVLTDIGLLDQ
jgi:hypothetical protein